MTGTISTGMTSTGMTGDATAAGDGAPGDDVRFEVAARIGRPVGEVFEAVVDPAELSRYFTTGGAVGRIEPGATVSWEFADFPGAFDVEVVSVEQDRRIVLRWPSDDGSGSRTTVTMSFEPLDDGRTLVSIAEEGWRPTAAGRRASYGNCEGWTNALCCLKAWIEHGIDLRTGYYA